MVVNVCKKKKKNQHYDLNNKKKKKKKKKKIIEYINFVKQHSGSLVIIIYDSNWLNEIIIKMKANYMHTIWLESVFNYIWSIRQ